MYKQRGYSREKLLYFSEISKTASGVDTSSITDFVPKASTCLCSDHFSTDAFTNDLSLLSRLGMSFRLRLRPDAVPSIFSHKPAPARERFSSAIAKRRKLEVMIKDACRL